MLEVRCYKCLHTFSIETPVESIPPTEKLKREYDKLEDKYEQLLNNFDTIKGKVSDLDECTHQQRKEINKLNSEINLKNETIKSFEKVINHYREKTLKLYPIGSEVVIKEQGIKGKISGIEIKYDDKLRYIIRYWFSGGYIQGIFYTEEIELPDNTLPVPTIDFSKDDLGNPVDVRMDELTQRLMKNS